MKRMNKFFSLFFILTLSFAAVSGCQKKEAACPFTPITWDCTLKDITELEGGYEESYDSVYGGTTYMFSREYDGLSGTIKYMFDDEGRLVCMSWMYESDDSEDLKAAYAKIHEEAEEMLGESGYKFNSDTFAAASSPSDVWYRKAGNVTLTMIDTSEVKALQYTFLHPDVSGEKPEK